MLRTKSCLAGGALCTLTLGLLVPVRPAHAQDRTITVDSLVESERAFSRLAGKIGYIPAFLAYFSDDVITFQPTPGAGKDRLREAAARMPVPPSVKADWEPWFAEAAGAGDLGYTTGPSIFTDAGTGKVLRTGWYFSVWKHDAYGWRVAADIGIQAPAAGPLRPRTIEPAGASTAGTGARLRDDIFAIERQLAAAIAGDGLAKGYRRFLGPLSRLYRDGSAPLVGAADIESFLGDQPAPLACRTVDAGASKSGDMAYSVGECDVPPPASGAATKAGFLRVWKSGATGWLLAADIVTR